MTFCWKTKNVLRVQIKILTVVEKYFGSGSIYYSCADIELCGVLLEKLAGEFSRVSVILYHEKKRGKASL